MSERKNWPTSRTIRKLEQIPMLAGLMGVTLYGLPIRAKAQVHGTAACYSHGGCRCGLLAAGEMHATAGHTTYRVEEA